MFESLLHRLGMASLSLVIALAQVAVAAASQPSPATTPRPQIALVLSGGGARGLAHVGVLEVLEEMGIPIDCVVGTSMGALVGGVYAAGVAPGTMRERLINTDLQALFDDDPPRTEVGSFVKSDDYRSLFDFSLGFNRGNLQLPQGASSGYKFELFLKEMVGSGAAVVDLPFDDLPLPFRAIATDLESGAMKVFSRGDLSRVLRASMSLPAVLAPVVIGDRIYADGGLVRNLPVDVAREFCGDVVIAVNLGTVPRTREYLTDSLAVASQALVLLTEQNVQRSLTELRPTDILIVPGLDEYSSSDFDVQQDIIDRGARAARALHTRLAPLALPPAEYSRWRKHRSASRLPELRVASITAAASTEISETAVLRDIHTGTGDRFDAAELGVDISHAFGRGDFSYIGYSLVPGEDGARVVIDATAKPWGPGFLKFGLSAATDFNSPNRLNVAASYKKNWINRLGASWRTDAQIGYDSFLTTEFVQPLQLRDGAFLAVYAGVRRELIQVYSETNHIGEFTVAQAQTGVDLGVAGTAGEFRIGPYVNYADSDLDFGLLTALFEEQELTQVGLRLRGVYDQLDSYAFPRTGVLLRLDVDSALSAWGADSDYVIARIGLSGARSFGNHTFAATVEWGDTLHDDGAVPIQNRFKLGGPMRLSGLFLDQLTGGRYNLATASYYNQYAAMPPQLGRGLYVGASLEGGRIDDPLSVDGYDWIGSGGIFWGADTILGAALLGYGLSTTGQGSWYLTLGQSF